MNEVEYVFNADIKEKKRIARGARNKVNGMNSKKCDLPSDHMSRKEFKSMHGEVRTWKMSEFYSWEEFKQMPNDLKVEYLKKLSEKYSVGLSTISTIVFGHKGNGTLTAYLKSHGLLEGLHIESHRGASSGRLKLIEDMKDTVKFELTISKKDDSFFRNMTEGSWTTNGFDDQLIASLKSYYSDSDILVRITVIKVQ